MEKKSETDSKFNGNEFIVKKKGKTIESKRFSCDEIPRPPTCTSVYVGMEVTPSNWIVSRGKLVDNPHVVLNF